MPPAARVTDLHTCPIPLHVGGPIAAGEPRVLIGFLPAARVGDPAVCVIGQDSIAAGSATVLIGGKPAARMGDLTSHGGTVVAGFPQILIGG
ncbi:PAAR domain-containing protein [Nannocystis pusilla]|uniref:PAAR domain-containing protein n=1 Tax=Nannocystis pusilla TaxID=889268 RepID=UPI003BF15DDE